MSVVRRFSQRIRESFRRRRRPVIARAGDQTDKPVIKGCIRCKIALLDGSDLTIDVDKQALGQDLVKKVLLNLDLVEKDYFGLQFMDTKQVPHWLDPTKKVRKQVKIGPPYTLHFRVKFYAAEPHELHEELTRYHFFLQIKQDMLRGKLKPTYEQIVGIGAYAVQSELGDYDSTLHHGNYVSEFRLVPDQTEELERAIEKRHRQLVSLTPADCEYESLKIAKNLENYGIDLHHVSRGGQETDSFTYHLNSARASKHLWKCAIEYHTFFRLVKTTEPVKRSNSFLRFGSRFRYSGRTLYQASKDDSVNARKSYKIKRTRSERYAQRSTIGYIRVGSHVWARAINGDYYRGQVTMLSEKIYIKFDHEDTIAHDRNDKNAVVFDMDPDPTEITVGTKVIAHWSGLSAYLPGIVARIEGNKYYVHYDDGDKGNNSLQQMRILKPPLFFGPGSGSSKIQKRLSMKATSLMGEGGRTSSSGAEERESVRNDSRQNGVTVSADIAPNARRSTSSSTKSTGSKKGETDSVFFAEFDSYSKEERSSSHNGSANERRVTPPRTAHDEYDSSRSSNRHGHNSGRHHPPPERPYSPPERSYTSPERAHSVPERSHSPPDRSLPPHSRAYSAPNRPNPPPEERPAYGGYDHKKYKVVQRTVKVGGHPSRPPNDPNQQMIVTDL